MPELALVKKEIPAFLGVNLRTDRLDLADEELARAINVDLHTFPGTIVLRYGRTKQFSTALTDLVIRRLGKINSKRYQVAGQSVYRNQTKIIDGLLSANLVTTLLPFRPLNDTAIWAFIADDAVMRKDDGTNTRIWGIVAPTVAANVQALGGGGLTGVYSMVYTYVRKTSTGAIAHESNASPASITVLLASQSIFVNGVTSPTDPQVTHVRFYRTLTGGALYQFEAEAAVTPDEYGYTHSWEADNITPQSGNNEYKFTTQLSSNYEYMFSWEKDTLNSAGSISANAGIVATQRQTGLWAWILAIADSALGTSLETDNDPPPEASWATAYAEHVFLARDADNPHYLWYSKRFRPESFPTDQFIEIGNPDDPIQSAVPIAGLLGIFTEQTKYRVIGNTTSGFVAVEAISKRGTPAYHAVIPSEQGVIFPARDGIFVTNLISADVSIGDKILPLFLNETVNEMSPINWDAAHTMAAAVYKQRYYLAYPSGAATSPDKLAVFSRDTERWYFYDHPMRSLFVEDDVDDLVGGGTDGFVYILEDGATDSGSNIALDVETKDFYGESTIRKLFMYFRVDADCLTTSITVGFYVDGVLTRSVTVSGNRTKVLHRLPEASMGYEWRAKITHTGSSRVKIYGISALWIPMENA